MTEYLKPVAPEHIKFLYDLANDAEVRRNSFSSDPIPWEDHEKWFWKKLEMGGGYLYFLEDKPVGQIRFDIDGSKATVSYTIAKEYRHKGYGNKMLGLAQLRLQNDHPEVTELLAQVKPENIASRHVFEKNNFSACFIEYQKRLR